MQYRLNNRISSQAFNSFQQFCEFIKKNTPQDPVTREPMYVFAFGPDVDRFTVKLGVIVHFIGSMKNVLGLSDIYYLGDQKCTFKMGSTIDFLHVYCDIIEHGLVGDTTTPFLRAIPVADRGIFG